MTRENGIKSLFPPHFFQLDSSRDWRKSDEGKRNRESVPSSLSSSFSAQFSSAYPSLAGECTVVKKSPHHSFCTSHLENL